MTWNLVKHPRVTDVVVADFDEAEAQEVVARVGGGKATGVKVDARDVDAVAALADGTELLINAVIPEWDEPLMKAALKAKCHYQDMATCTEGGTIDDGLLMQMAMDAECKAIDKTALIHCGMTPGVTNTLAAIGYEELDRCEEIRINGGVFKSEVPLQVWSQETYYIDSQTHTLYFDDGEFKRAEPFAGCEYYDFPTPVGCTPVTFHEHEECSTLPRFLPDKYGDKGLKHPEFKLGGNEESLKKAEMIVKMGFASPDPIEVKGVQIRPIDLLVKLLPETTPRDVIAKMAEEGRIIDEGVYAIELWRTAGELPAESSFVFPPNIQWVNERLPGANRVSYGTSTPAAILAEYLLDGKIPERGIVPPEAISREARLAYVEEPKRRGLKIARRSTRWL